LRAGLEGVAAEDSRLSLLIDGCLHVPWCVQGKGLLINHVESVARVDFHNLNYALGSLYDLADGTKRLSIAYAASALFTRRGVGTYVRESHLAGGQDSDDGVQRRAVGKPLNAAFLDAAIRPLGVGSERDDQALAGFVRGNAKTLSPTQRQQVVRLVTYPDLGPAGFGADAAFATTAALPGDNDLRLLWEHWIKNGLSDGLAPSGDDPSGLAFWIKGRAAGTARVGQHRPNPP